MHRINCPPVVPRALLGRAVGILTIFTMLVLTVGPRRPVEAAPGSATFNYTGAVQSWVVPNGVTEATFDVYGAEGGQGVQGSPGRGGQVTATITVTPGSTVYIFVGGRGGSVFIGAECGVVGLGGFNGGGNGGSTSDVYCAGSGGGGASDVRIGGTDLANRVLVAGGGGGSGVQGGGCADGGGGGGLSGGVGGNPSVSCSFGAGGAGGNQDGSSGSGQMGNGSAGESSPDLGGGGGGGGGYYGGAGGALTLGGGGGSGFGPMSATFETGVRSGNGLVTVSFVLPDTTPPDTTITDMPANPSNSSSAEFKFTAEDDDSGVAGYECKLDGGSFTACTSPANYSGLGVGSHTFQVRARDAAGNVDPTPASVTWTVDTTAPNTNITMAPPAFSNSSSMTIEFSGTDNGMIAEFDCRLDSATFSVCSSPKRYDDLAEGSHTVQVRARDTAGNVDGTPAVATWIVDLTPPVTTAVTNPPLNNGWARSGGAVTLSAVDQIGLSGVDRTEYQLDGGAWTLYSGPVSITGAGAHILRYRSLDRAGNQEAEKTLAFNIDLTAPELSYRFDTATGGVQVYGRDEAGGSGVTNSGPIAPATCATQRTGQQCIYRVTDVAGNTVTITLLRSTTGGQTRVQVVAVQYSGRVVTTPLANETVYEYAQSGGVPSSLVQCATVTQPPAAGQPARTHKLCARWTGGDTTLEFVSPAAPGQVRAGLGLLQVVTRNGALVIEAP